MLVEEAAKRGINNDGWYELEADGRYRVYIENGKVVRGTRPDGGIGIVPSWPYVRYDAHSYTSATGQYELKDLVSGKVVMM